MGLIAWLFGSNNTSQDLRYAGKTLRIVGDGNFRFEIVGESYYQDAFDAITGGKDEAGYNYRIEVAIEEDSENPYDANAVRIQCKGETLGYLSRENAIRYRTQLADLGLAGASLKAAACIRGGWISGDGDEGLYGLKIDMRWPLKISAS